MTTVSRVTGELKGKEIDRGVVRENPNHKKAQKLARKIGEALDNGRLTTKENNDLMGRVNRLLNSNEGNLKEIKTAFNNALAGEGVEESSESEEEEELGSPQEYQSLGVGGVETRLPLPGEDGSQHARASFKIYAVASNGSSKSSRLNINEENQRALKENFQKIQDLFSYVAAEGINGEKIVINAGAQLVGIKYGGTMATFTIRWPDDTVCVGDLGELTRMMQLAPSESEEGQLYTALIGFKEKLQIALPKTAGAKFYNSTENYYLPEEVPFPNLKGTIFEKQPKSVQQFVESGELAELLVSETNLNIRDGQVEEEEGHPNSISVKKAIILKRIAVFAAELKSTKEALKEKIQKIEDAKKLSTSENDKKRLTNQIGYLEKLLQKFEEVNEAVVCRSLALYPVGGNSGEKVKAHAKFMSTQLEEKLLKQQRHSLWKSSGKFGTPFFREAEEKIKIPLGPEIMIHKRATREAALLFINDGGDLSKGKYAHDQFCIEQGVAPESTGLEAVFFQSAFDADLEFDRDHFVKFGVSLIGELTKGQPDKFFNRKDELEPIFNNAINRFEDRAEILKEFWDEDETLFDVQRFTIAMNRAKIFDAVDSNGALPLGGRVTPAANRALDSDEQSDEEEVFVTGKQEDFADSEWVDSDSEWVDSSNEEYYTGSED